MQEGSPSTESSSGCFPSLTTRIRTSTGRPSATSPNATCRRSSRSNPTPEAETARISLRNARRDAVEAFKKAQKEGMSEDEAKDGETQAQKLLDKFTKSLDAILDNKEKEIMTV